MADRMTNRKILHRLRAATGPDRHLDFDIALAVGLVTQCVGSDGMTWFSTAEYPAFLGVPKGQRGEFGLVTGEGRNYTSSIDAALTLVETTLPGWGADLYWRPALRGHTAAIGYGESLEHATVGLVAWTLPIAIMIALFAALVEDVHHG